MLPSRRTVTDSGSRSWPSACAFVFGRSTGTPTVSSGAVTMNTMSSTSITSTNGVTLISAIGRLRRRRPRPFGALTQQRPSAAAFSSSWRDRIAENSSAKRVEPVDIAADVVDEVVVENHRRNRGEQAHRGGKQRFGDAGRDDGQRRVMARGDRRERIHDAPHRAEQVRRRARSRRQSRESPVGVRCRRVSRRMVTDIALSMRSLMPASSDFARRAAFESAAPFAQRGDEHRRHRMIGAVRELLVELIQRQPRPERSFRICRRGGAARQRDPFVDDDRPRPQRGQHAGSRTPPSRSGRRA